MDHRYDMILNLIGQRLKVKTGMHGHGKNISLDAMLKDQNWTRVDKIVKNGRTCGNISLKASLGIGIFKGCHSKQRAICNFHHGTKHASHGRIAETLTPRAVTCSPHEI